jgi:polysaccharide export outer membrane protein
MNKKNTFLFAIVLIHCLSSCSTREKIVYFQDKSVDSVLLQSNYTPTLKTDDFLSILVTADDTEAAAAFNFPPGTQQNFNNGYVIGNPAIIGYLVNANGEIKLPIIGALKVAGLNRMEAT